MHSLPRSSLNPFQMIYANFLQNVLFSKYFCANINLLCTLSQGPLSTFPSCFMVICYKIFLCANIVSQISNYHLSLNPRAFFQLFPGAFCKHFTKYVCANIDTVGLTRFYWILSSNPAILVEISTRITEFSERIQ